jgi:hypothetical protein
VTNVASFIIEKSNKKVMLDLPLRMDSIATEEFGKGISVRLSQKNYSLNQKKRLHFCGMSLSRVLGSFQCIKFVTEKDRE